MSYNGSGTFVINSAGMPLVPFARNLSATINSLTADLAIGLSTAITKDGQTTTTALITFAAGISSTLVTDATSISTGSLLTSGGLGVTKAAWIGGLINVAGAATLQSTLAVTGTSTMAAINASGVLGITTNNIYMTQKDSGGTQRAIMGLGNDNNLYIGDLAGFSGGIKFGANGLYAMTLSSAGNLSMTGTLGVTGAISGTTGTFTKAAAGDVLVLTNGGATPKPLYFYSDASTSSIGTSASQGGSLLAFVSTTSAQLNISGGAVQTWTTAGTSVTGTLGVTGVATLGAGAILNTPASGNLSTCTADGTDQVGFKNIPQNSQSASYTLVLADAGKHIFHPSTDANARTFTIPSNANVAYPIGTALTFVNMTAAVVTIAITTDTMYLSSTGGTGSRSLAIYGSATALKMTTTTWLISGSNLT